MPQVSPVTEYGDSHTPLPHTVDTVPEYTGVADGEPSDGDAENDGVFDGVNPTDGDADGVTQQSPNAI